MSNEVDHVNKSIINSIIYYDDCLLFYYPSYRQKCEKVAPWGNFFKVLINYDTWGYKNMYWCLVTMIFYFISVQIYHRLIHSIKMHSIIPIKAPISGQEISFFIFGKWSFTMLKQIILYFKPNEFTRTLKHLQNERSIW